MDYQTFLHFSLLDNSIQRWLAAVAVTFLLFLLTSQVRRFVIKQFNTLHAKTKLPLHAMLSELVAVINGGALSVVALYVGSQIVALPPNLSRFITGLTIIAIAIQAGLLANHLIRYGLKYYLDTRRTTTSRAMLQGVRILCQIALWSMLLLVVLDTLGVDVTALITGLGIGGIAVGFALQNIFSDLFASLSITFDQPFELGDFIVVGDFKGHVENIGLKTTRLRSLSGEQLIFSNSDLLQSRIRNYKRMGERRIEFSIGVTYDTPKNVLTQIPSMIQHAVESTEKTRFSRAHFYEFADSALIFQTVYFVLNREFDDYMDAQQSINLSLVEQFTDKNIEFAFPTQTIHVASQPNVQAIAN